MNEYPVSAKIYHEKVRVRVCGILIEDSRILMLKHNNLGPKGYLWAPPGGGVEFHDTATSALIKEFLEETGLEVSICDFLFVNEYIDQKYHAVELFFQVEKKGGRLKLGTDPEVPAEEQILDEFKWFTFAELDAMDHSTLHSIFGSVKSSKKILELRGFYNFINISG